MSDLFIVLLRRARIPTKSILGWVYSLSTNSFEGHAWVEYFTPNNEWIQCDPTWGFLVGVRCQHIYRMREAINTDIADSSINYNSKDELPRMLRVRHPPMIETMERLKDTTTEIYFTHFNHTYKTLELTSKERKETLEKGFKLAYDRLIIELRIIFFYLFRAYL